MASLTATEPQPLSILVPIPPQGHITPFLRLATLLLSRGFRVTFVLTEYNARHLAQSRGHDWATAGGPSFRVETIPDDLPPPPSDKQDVTQDILSVYLSIPVLENLRLRDFPTFVRTTNPDDVMLNLIVCRATINAPRCAGLILNTFAALEGPVLDTIPRGRGLPLVAGRPTQRLRRPRKLWHHRSGHDIAAKRVRMGPGSKRARVLVGSAAGSVAGKRCGCDSEGDDGKSGGSGRSGMEISGMQGEVERCLLTVRADEEMKHRAIEWKEKARDAFGLGGSSTTDINRLVVSLMQMRK
ncbi:hypothetical protein ZIOFF_007563 [Zingiber officinale]|uniref:Uncharacterized protein n=1 Tax=Zingiber officinale TaxID=94328 RepID=A0A8J5HRH8_ZINOF|nr:hypothetical protein ZIOFF_007563 [Zingiber officinale]